MKTPEETRILDEDEVRSLRKTVFSALSEGMRAALLECGIDPEDMIRMRSMGAMFRHAREARNETLKETSTHLKIAQYKIRNIESPSFAPVEPEVLRALSSYFGLDEWCSRWAGMNQELAGRLGMPAWVKPCKTGLKRSLKGFSELHLQQVESQVKRLVESRRPPEHIRTKLDIGYRITGQSFEIFEIRPKWLHPGITQEFPVAKATYVKSSGLWKLYWMRSDLRWHRYDMLPGSESLRDVLVEIEEDPYCCFWG